MSIWAYYLGMNEFERMSHDTRSIKKVNSTFYESYLPIIVSDDANKILEFKVNLNIFQAKCN